MNRLSDGNRQRATAYRRRGGRLALLGLVLASLFASVLSIAPGAALAATPGSVLIWGDNRSSQLGSGATGVERAAPGPIPGTSAATIAVAGGATTPSR